MVEEVDGRCQRVGSAMTSSGQAALLRTISQRDFTGSDRGTARGSSGLRSGPLVKRSTTCAMRGSASTSPTLSTRSGSAWQRERAVRRRAGSNTSNRVRQTGLPRNVIQIVRPGPGIRKHSRTTNPANRTPNREPNREPTVNRTANRTVNPGPEPRTPNPEPDPEPRTSNPEPASAHRPRSPSSDQSHAGSYPPPRFRARSNMFSRSRSRSMTCGLRLREAAASRGVRPRRAGMGRSSHLR
jgi:hypothetical protein